MSLVEIAEMKHLCIIHITLPNIFADKGYPAFTSNKYNILLCNHPLFISPK